jgi:hypothetical protein
MTSRFVKHSKHWSIIKEQMGNLAFVNNSTICSPFFTSVKNRKCMYAVFEYTIINGTTVTARLIKYTAYAPDSEYI